MALARIFNKKFIYPAVSPKAHKVTITGLIQTEQTARPINENSLSALFIIHQILLIIGGEKFQYLKR
jgi:hypothetical protein